MLATGGYTPALGFFRSAVLPLHSHVLATAPIAEADWQRLRWGAFDGFSDDLDRIAYAMRTPGGRLLLGGGGNPAYTYHYGSRAVTTERAIARAQPFMARLLQRYFPAIADVPIRTNEKTRESRLFKSMGQYVRRNTVSIFRIYSMYEPLKVFMTAAAIVGLLAVVVWTRFLVSWVQGEGAGHVQSLILGAVLFNAAVVLGALGIIGDLLSGQRIMLQRIFERVRRIELHNEIPPSHYEPGAAPTGQPPTTGANAGQTEEREALKL